MISMDSGALQSGWEATAQRAGREGQKIQVVITHLCLALGF